MVKRIFFREKKISWACLEASGLDKIFNLYAHCNILDKSSLKDSDKKVEPGTTKKIKVSSKFSGKLLIYVD